MGINETGLGKLLVILGAFLILVGAVIWAGKITDWPRLPGDILIKRDNFTFYFPITTAILMSILITIIIFLVKRCR